MDILTQMKYVSTRGQCAPMKFSEAVSEGLAPDGGLFVPETLPNIADKLPEWANLDYPELCFRFLSLFADDIDAQDLRKIVAKSYTRFDVPEIAPLRRLSDDVFLLELYHGPTLAFKDFALQFLGNLYEYLLAKSGRRINVLGATSGDTGSAAINGLLGKKNVNIFILYPNGRVSPLQERQMTCTGAENVFPIAVSGTFDDAQAIVKELFGDTSFKARWNLSAVNSINLARILAQCVYYIYAWGRLPADLRRNPTFIVPTGNFGNILAGWIAWKMGMPAAGFRVATNQNDILYRLFKTGVYEVSQVRPSYAPSMDIQVASNFERLIWFAEGGDSEKVRRIMTAFKRDGKWTFGALKADGFSASKMEDSQIPLKIAEIRQKYGAVIDPHTACGFADLSGEGAKIVLSTAHPAKFPELVGRAVGKEPTSDALEALKSKKIKMCAMPADSSLVRKYIEENGIQ